MSKKHPFFKNDLVLLSLVVSKKYHGPTERPGLRSFFLHSMKLCCRFLGTKEKEASPLDQTKETEEAEAD
mgnify:CR=1 FL=1